MPRKICAVIALIAVSLSTANALSCYECHTAHEGCKDPFNSTNIPTVNCSSLYYSSRANEFGVRATSLEALTDDYSRASDSAQYECYSYHTTYLSNHTEVVRGCRIIDNPLCETMSNASVGAGFSVNNCYTCQEDYCNAGMATSATAMMAALSAFFAISKLL